MLKMENASMSRSKSRKEGTSMSDVLRNGLCYYLIGGIGMENFGKKLYKLRKEHGLTQAQLAEKLRLNVKTIERLEAGKNIPKLENLQTISDYFNVSISYWYQKDY